jgi:hypothetical protein
VNKTIFVNLPVSDLARSVRFYEAIGFTKNEDFSNDQGVAMLWSDEIWVMLLTYPFYRKFIAGRSIPDAKDSAQVLLALSLNSKQAVDNMASLAVANGATLLPEVVIEGADGMYGADFTDPDGHIWELVYMEM